jgi:hypothetical protein
MSNFSNRSTNVLQPNWLMSPVSQLDQETIINSLRSTDPVTYHYQFNMFIGKTKDGALCYFPESYRRGYQDFLDGQKLLIELELLSIGQCSDGNWVFLPSYFQGVESAWNELKFVLLDESQRRLFDETSKTGQELQKRSQLLENILAENTQNRDALTTLQTGYENLRAENQNLQETLKTQKKILDEYRKQTEELKNQLQEVRTMNQRTSTQQIKTSSSELRSNDKRGEKRKAAPIS